MVQKTHDGKESDADAEKDDAEDARDAPVFKTVFGYGGIDGAEDGDQ